MRNAFQALRRSSTTLWTAALLSATVGIGLPVHAQTLYVPNHDGIIEKFNSSGVGTQFNVSGDLYAPGGLAFGPETSSVPEPGNVALLIGLGLTGAGLLARRRK